MTAPKVISPEKVFDPGNIFTANITGGSYKEAMA